MDDLQSMVERAVHLRRAGDLDGAEELYRRCWDGRDPEWSARAGWELGEILLQRGRLAEALAILRQAIDTWGHPYYGARAMITLGVALARSGDHAAAEQQYRLVSSLGDPDLVHVARFNLGQLAHERGESAEAIAHYRTVVAGGHPEMAPQAGTNLGVLLSSLGRWADARAAFEHVVASGHPHQAALARRNLALLEMAGQHPEGSR